MRCGVKTHPCPHGRENGHGNMEERNTSGKCWCLEGKFDFEGTFCLFEHKSTEIAGKLARFLGNQHCFQPCGPHLFTPVPIRL